MKHGRIAAPAWLALSASAQDLRSAVESYVAAHRSQTFSEVVELLSIPSSAAASAWSRYDARGGENRRKGNPLNGVAAIL